MSDYFNNYFSVIDEKSKSIDYKELISAAELADKANKDGGNYHCGKWWKCSNCKPF